MKKSIFFVATFLSWVDVSECVGPVNFDNFLRRQTGPGGWTGQLKAAVSDQRNIWSTIAREVIEEWNRSLATNAGSRFCDVVSVLVEQKRARIPAGVYRTYSPQFIGGIAAYIARLYGLDPTSNIPPLAVEAVDDGRPAAEELHPPLDGVGGLVPPPPAGAVDGIDIENVDPAVAGEGGGGGGDGGAGGGGGGAGGVDGAGGVGGGGGGAGGVGDDHPAAEEEHPPLDGVGGLVPPPLAGAGDGIVIDDVDPEVADVGGA